MARRVEFEVAIDIDRLKQDTDNARLSVDRLTGGVDKLQSELNQAEQEARDLTRQLDQMQREGKENTDQYRQLNQRLQENSARLNRARQANESNTQSLIRAKTRQDQLTRSVEAYNKSVQASGSRLSALRNNISGLFGSLTVLTGGFNIFSGAVGAASGAGQAFNAAWLAASNILGGAISNTTRAASSLEKYKGATEGAVTSSNRLVGGLTSLVNGLSNFAAANIGAVSAVGGVIAILGSALAPILRTTSSINFQVRALDNLASAWAAVTRFLINARGIGRGRAARGEINLDNIVESSDTAQLVRNRLVTLERVNKSELANLRNLVRAQEITYRRDREALQVQLERAEAAATDPSNLNVEERQAALREFERYIKDLTELDNNYYGNKLKLEEQLAIRDRVTTESEIKGILEVELTRTLSERERVAREKQRNAAQASINALLAQNQVVIEQSTESVEEYARAWNDYVNAVREAEGVDESVLQVDPTTESILRRGLFGTDFTDPQDDGEVRFQAEKSRLIQENLLELHNYRLALIDEQLLRVREAFGEESFLARALSKIKAVEIAGQAGVQLASFNFEKKIAFQKALVNKALGESNAAASVPFPFNIAIIAATVAQFAGIIASLIGAGRNLIGSRPPTFEKGGILPIGGKRHSAGGTKYYGEDGNVFEAEKGEALVLNRGATSALMPLFNQMNLAHGGSSLYHNRSSYLQTGGVASGQPLFDIDRLADRITDGVVEGVSKLRPVVAVEDINRGQDRVDVILNGARF